MPSWKSGLRRALAELMVAKMLNMWRWVKTLWARYIPNIVWRRQPVQVGIHFDLSKVDRQDIFEIEKLLNKNGIYFDTGAGCGNRDWELDWSLRGPVEVRFKRKKQIL